MKTMNFLFSVFGGFVVGYLLAIMASSEPTRPSLPSNTYIPKVWTVVEDVVPSQFDVSKLKPCSFHKSNIESPIIGEEMRKRAVEFKANFGDADGRRMLAEQDKIPVEFRDFRIVFPGTVLRDSDGNLRIPVLGLDHLSGRWVMDFDFLSGGWYHYHRFACTE